MIIARYEFTALDGNGNRKAMIATEPIEPESLPGATSYAYNAQKNRLASAGGAIVTYDDEGQMRRAGNTFFTFNYAHQLEIVDSATTDEYRYDGKGNRLKAIRAGVVTKYVYDAAGNLLAEADVNNTITRYYIQGLGLMAMVAPSGNTVYTYHFNPVGSTVAITDQSRAIVNKYAYAPFGGILGQSETVPQPFKFVGQFGVMAEPNGLYYMRARYYDPSLGRFISEDPLSFGGGDVNLMAYAGNNPVNAVDPWGLFDFQQFLQDTSKYASVAAMASALTPGWQAGFIVFSGISATATGLEISLYSNHPVIDTAGESVKMALPVKEPYNIGTDKAIDSATDQVKSMIDSNKDTSSNNQNNSILSNMQSTVGCHASQ